MSETLTERQIKLIEGNKATFGDKLRVEAVFDYESDLAKDAWKTSGQVFLYILVPRDEYRPIQYVTSLGHFEDPHTVREMVKQLLDT